jgi:Holliday junction resolvase RusA-like endonuclease
VCITHLPEGASLVIMFTAHGTPIPQGSPKIGRRGNRAVLLLDSEKLRHWRRIVAAAARDACRDAPKIEVGQRLSKRRVVYDEPVVVNAAFYFEKPAKPLFDVTQASKPDLDKLQRALGDSLTDAGVVSDDCRIVRWGTAKLWGEPRVMVAVEPLSACEAWLESVSA